MGEVTEAPMEDVAADRLAWQASGGFGVDGSVRVAGEDRGGHAPQKVETSRSPSVSTARVSSTRNGSP